MFMRVRVASTIAAIDAAAAATTVATLFTGILLF